MDVLDSTTYVNGGPRIGYQIEASIYANNSAILKDSLPTKEKDPGSFTLPCYINNICFEKALAYLGASISVMPLTTFTNLGLGDLAPTKLTVELADRTLKLPNGVAENVLVGIGLRERMDLYLEARLMGKTLMMNRSQDPSFKDFIELIDLNKPLELRRNQVIDLGPTIKEGEVINDPMIEVAKTRNDDATINGIVEYLSYYKVKYKGKNVVGYFTNVPNFIGNFFVVTDFAVMENVDAYRDEDMRDVIVGEPFCRVLCVEAKRFDGFITIHNGNDSVTYQMAHSHPRFKHLTNKICNKMLSLLKVSTHDNLNGISHPYLKLKGFYMGVLNLGPEYIRDTKIKERLTCGQISMHEME
nr:hypothetical protein [Tanacetum cinerariifolium]